MACKPIILTSGCVHWFVGGPSQPSYKTSNQIQHRSPNIFSKELGKVWDRLGKYAFEETRLVVRFGAINSRPVDYDEILKQSLEESSVPWRLVTSISAGDSSNGQRQSLTMGARARAASVIERDYYIRFMSS